MTECFGWTAPLTSTLPVVKRSRHTHLSSAVPSNFSDRLYWFLLGLFWSGLGLIRSTDSDWITGHWSLVSGFWFWSSPRSQVLMSLVGFQGCFLWIAVILRGVTVVVEWVLSAAGEVVFWRCRRTSSRRSILFFFTVEYFLWLLCSNPAAERVVSEFQIVFWKLPCPSCRKGGKEGGRARGRWVGGKGEGGQDVRRRRGRRRKKTTCQMRSGGCWETMERAVLQFKPELGQTQLHFVEAISGSLSYTIWSCCVRYHGNKGKSRKPRFQLLLRW